MSSSQYLEAMGIETWKLRNQSSSELGTDEEHLKEQVEDNDVSTMDFEQLGQTVSNCQACQLCSSRTNTVFGSGSHNAEIMLVGEAPGEQEDVQGEPFVGRAGKLLTSMIFSLGLERSDIYICNVVKCRPPKNRNPSPQEAQACSAFLLRQIELISPKIIVALGLVSAHLLLDTELPLSRLRGTIYKYKESGVDLIATYHPAYLLRKPTEKAKSWEDLWKIKQLVAEKN